MKRPYIDRSSAAQCACTISQVISKRPFADVAERRPQRGQQRALFGPEASTPVPGRPLKALPSQVPTREPYGEAMGLDGFCGPPGGPELNSFSHIL